MDPKRCPENEDRESENRRFEYSELLFYLRLEDELVEMTICDAKMSKRFEFLEHTADAYVAAYGRNLAEAFENAALAMFEVMTDAEKIKPRVEETVEVEAHDRQSLLYNWLEELLVRFELSNILYSRFSVQEMGEKRDCLWLKAKISGEPFDEAKHRQKVGVKAITYHRMEIEEKPGKVTLRFILDI